MTLMEAAQKWHLSTNWVRELIKSKRIPSKLRTDVPVHFYEIPDGTPKPKSMQRSPARKGSTAEVQLASIKRREYRKKEKLKAQTKPQAKAKLRSKK